MHIGSTPVGGEHPAYIIAEMSANHRGDIAVARELVTAIAATGANAVKVQTFTADTITIDHEGEPFRIDAGTVWDGRTLHDLYAEAAMPWDWQRELNDLAQQHGLTFFSSPFDPKAVQFLESLDVPAYKIASAELVDVGLIQKVAATGKPIILSTGMATLDEIEEAVAAARAGGATEIALLKCTSAYPAPAAEMNLATIPDMRQRFGVPVGLSDHTVGIGVAIAAVTLGASIIEKHVTLRREDGGPDSGFSLEPDEFREMVEMIRLAEAARGTVSYVPTAHEVASRALRRSLFVVADVRAGDVLTEENVRSIRPGHGLHTRHLPEVLGRRASRDLKRGEPLAWDLIAPE